MEPLTFGLIGAGMIGRAHATTLVGIEGVQLKAIADVNREAADLLAEETVARTATADYQKLLADADIDAVVICTPPYLHHQMVLETIAAGKHVLCEKPFAHSAAAADEMVAAAERAGLVLADCSARHARLNPTYRTVKALLDAGRVGEVYLIHHYGRGRRGRPGIEYHPAAKWFLDRKKAVGGAAVDWGVYDLSLIWGLLGDEVSCEQAIGFTFRGVDEVDPGAPIYDVEEHGGGCLKLSNGVTVLWDRASACHMDGGSETRLYGSRGGLRFEAWNRGAEHLTWYHDAVDGLPTETPVPIRGQREHGGDHPHVDRDFVDALRTGRPPMMPGKVAARVLRAIEMIYQSAGAA